MVALDTNFIIRFILGSSEEASDLNLNVSRVLHNIPDSVFLIPTPALSEALARLSQDEMIGLCTLFRRSKYFVVQPFDMAASIEAAMAAKKAREAGAGKRAGSAESWQKVKVDFQIAAIAKVHNANRIYTSDTDIDKISPLFDIETVSLSEIEPHPSESQQNFSFAPPPLH